MAVDVIEDLGGAQNVLGADAPPLAPELVATARTANAFEDAGAHQRLQDWLEMARRKRIARRQGLGRYRPPLRVNGDVDDSRDGQEAFARQQRHADDPSPVRIKVIYYRGDLVHSAALNLVSDRKSTRLNSSHLG